MQTRPPYLVLVPARRSVSQPVQRVTRAIRPATGPVRGGRSGAFRAGLVVDRHMSFRERVSSSRAIDVRCPACLGDGRALSPVVDEHFRLVRCRKCRTQYFRPDASLTAQVTPTISDYWEKYKFAMYSDPAVQEDYERRYGAVLEAAERVVGPIRSVLDVGCGIGNFVSFAGRTGRLAYGVDVDRDAVRAARERGLDVSHSDDLDALVEEPLDAVSMWDVIEHLYDPEPVVRQVLKPLRPGGVLLLETPDAGFPLRQVVLGVHGMSKGRVDYTRAMYYWEHKIYFTLPGLRHLMDRCGCDVVLVRRLTSPKAKMQKIFDRKVDRRGSLPRRVMAGAWPLLESGVRRAGMGNKLIVVVRKRTADQR